MTLAADTEYQLYKDAFVYAFVGKAIVDLSGGWLQFNASFPRILGYQEQELSRKNFYQLFGKQGESILENLLRDQSTHAEHEIVYSLPSVTCLWLLMNITLVKKPAARPYFILQILDITARKENERKIERLNTEMNLILDSVNEGIYGIDLNAKVRFWNAAAERLTGYKLEELQAGSIHDLIHHTNKQGERVPMEECPMFTMLNNGASMNVQDDLFWRKDGTSFPVEYSFSPIYQNNAYVGSVITFSDVTERNQSTEQIIRSEKLSMAGQLAAGIAHELRNPLTSLKGFLRLLQSPDAKRDYYLGIMESELVRIEEILSELLMLAKPQDVHYQQKDASDILAQIVALMQPQAHLKDVELVLLGGEAPAPAPVYCDDNQIKQVIVNLIKNAIEAMPEGGRIEVSAERAAGRVWISIKDNGIGIPEEKLKQLGEPFFSTKEKGTGLGLMVSYKIIENHNGKISVLSQPGLGTIFTVSLPCTE